MQQSIQLVSVGRHTRLGDVLERAVEDVSFETVRSEDFPDGNAEKRRLLFAISGDGTGANDELSALTCRILSGGCSFGGSVCGAVADGERGGALHADVLKLLLALNGAGCAIANGPCVEASRNLKNLSYQSGDEKIFPFELYGMQARALARRLMAFEAEEEGAKRLRFVSTLESEGAGRDWREALGRELAKHGGAFAEDGGPADATLLLCENTSNIPGETTLRMLDGFDACALSCIVASPRFGADFYCMQILERACLQGACSLAPYGFAVCDGATAAEALAVDAMFENAGRAIRKLLQ